MNKLWEILVPKHDNLGFLFHLAHHREWDAEVLRITNGLTVFRSTVTGSWRAADGTLFRDSMIPVRIMCSEQEIDRIARMTIEHYNQEAVMYYVVSDLVRIVER